MALRSSGVAGQGRTRRLPIRPDCLTTNVLAISYGGCPMLGLPFTARPQRRSTATSASCQASMSAEVAGPCLGAASAPGGMPKKPSHTREDLQVSWRSDMGVEPTQDGITAPQTVLKTAPATGPDVAPPPIIPWRTDCVILLSRRGRPRGLWALDWARGREGRSLGQRLRRLRDLLLPFVLRDPVLRLAERRCLDSARSRLMVSCASACASALVGLTTISV